MGLGARGSMRSLVPPQGPDRCGCPTLGARRDSQGASASLQLAALTWEETYLIHPLSPKFVWLSLRKPLQSAQECREHVGTCVHGPPRLKDGLVPARGASGHRATHSGLTRALW